MPTDTDPNEPPTPVHLLRSVPRVDYAVARAVLAERVAAKLPNMVLASTYVAPDGAVAAFLLHRLLSRGDSTRVSWHTVFLNSGVEALGTVVKYLRNRHNRQSTDRACRILVLDPTETAHFAFGHAVPGLTDTGADGIEIVTTISEFVGALVAEWDSYVVVADGLSAADAARVREALATTGARAHAVAWGILDDEAALDTLRDAVPECDLVFFGEVCTAGEVPCGVVSFTRTAFALWNNPLDSVAHVSTFGGNGLALQLLCETVTRWRPTDRYERGAIDRMRRSAVVRSARLRMHSNTWQTRAIDIASINLIFDRADGVAYHAGARRYVDLASGAGPAFRGHNRQSPELIATAGTAGDETAQLAGKLGVLTGLPVLLPAVSGQSAVDNAVLAALSCRPGRGTIVTLRGNYSGKGPISMALSRTSSFFRDRDSFAFAPYPVEVIEADIDDLEGLRRTLRRDDIALVWLELVQGYDCVEVPRPVLDEIQRCRAPSGYLVGVDEVFTGFWRCDPDNFLFGTGRGVQPDVVAISKGLSDALVPIGAALISAEVFAELRRLAPPLAHWLREHYRNDMAAALALAAIEEAEGNRKGAQEVAAALEDMLARAAHSPLFDGYHRAGLLGRLVLSPRAIGANPRPSVRNYAEAVIARLVAQHCGAITLQLRLAPCTAGDYSAELVATLADVGAYLQRLPRWTVDRTALLTLFGTLGRELGASAVRVRESRSDRRRA